MGKPTGFLWSLHPCRTYPLFFHSPATSFSLWEKENTGHIYCKYGRTCGSLAILSSDSVWWLAQYFTVVVGKEPSALCKLWLELELTLGCFPSFRRLNRASGSEGKATIYLWLEKIKENLFCYFTCRKHRLALRHCLGNTALHYSCYALL